MDLLFSRIYSSDLVDRVFVHPSGVCSCLSASSQITWSCEVQFFVEKNFKKCKCLPVLNTHSYDVHYCTLLRNVKMFAVV